jgi:hypothetical protein
MGVERLLAEGREVAFLSSPAVSPTSGPAGIPSASLARHPIAPGAGGDRGHILLFRPSALEVHLRTAGWFWRQEIFDFFAAHLVLITEPSMRHYILASERQRAGLDWKSFVLQRFTSGRALQVARLRQTRPSSRRRTGSGHSSSLALAVAPRTLRTRSGFPTSRRFPQSPWHSRRRRQKNVRKSRIVRERRIQKLRRTDFHVPDRSVSLG